MVWPCTTQEGTAEHIKEHNSLLVLTGHGTPRDLADAAVEAVLCMDRQPGVLQQSAVLAGIASVRQVHDQQVSCERSDHAQRKCMQQGWQGQACALICLSFPTAACFNVILMLFQLMHAY